MPYGICIDHHDKDRHKYIFRSRVKVARCKCGAAVKVDRYDYANAHN